VLLILEAQELTVGELCSVLQLPQSTASRHLRLLGDDKWIVSRQDGTSRYYSRNPRLESDADRLWTVVREEMGRSVFAKQDLARLSGIVNQRREKSREFFAAATRWDATRNELFGVSADLVGLVGLLDDRWTVGDLGCGTGRLSEVLAPNVSRVIGVDGSPEMLAAAGRRLSGLPNVELRQGELEALPIDRASLDAAVLSFVLHYTTEPARVFAEVARTMCPAGRLLVVDMLPHERAEYRQQMGHVWLGFSEEQIREWLGDAGFERIRFRCLPADAAAKGPLLFAASAMKSAGRAGVVRSNGSGAKSA
jgi:ArsR family transcriptional regulator